VHFVTKSKVSFTFLSCLITFYCALRSTLIYTKADVNDLILILTVVCYLIIHLKFIITTVINTLQ